MSSITGAWPTQLPAPISPIGSQCRPSDHQTSTTAPPLCRQFPVTLPRTEMVNGLLKGGGNTDPDDSCYQSEGYFSAFHIDVIILKNTLTLSEHSAGR